MELSEKKHPILYVDDEEDNLVVFKSAFRRHFQVFTATSAAEGLDIVNNNHIELVITDQRMPNMTGVQFLQNLPDDEENIRMILTGFSDVQAIIDAINTGKVYRYITKPWDKDELKITIDNAIEALQLRKKNKELIHELQQANESLEAKVEERTGEVNRQKEKIEELLLNILPAQTAQELQLQGKAQPRKYEQVTVMFADIQQFTSICENLAPETLVEELDRCFSAFDAIMERYGIEKIKTIGDAYLCASGLPYPNADNPANVVRAALDMQAFMQQLKHERQLLNLPHFDLRIGIHTGPIVAGVVGTKKFAYDIWGDTVNTAARLEQCGEPGRINLSETTHALVKDQFACSARGLVEAKGKGHVEMYFIERDLVPESQAVPV